MALLSIIIVNWNCAELLGRCLQSVFQEQPGFGFEVIIVDNSAGSDPIDPFIKEYGEVRLIRNHFNRGFSAACNQGAAEAKGKYLLFLNPDTRLHSGTLNNSMAYMESQPEPTIMGCLTLNPDGSVQKSARRFPGLAGIFLFVSGLNIRINQIRKNRPMPQRPDYIQGSFMMLQSRLFRQLGGFDEGFFLYGEDVDLCLRARRMGVTISYNTESVITHEGGGCSTDPLFRTAHFITGCRQLYLKYRSVFIRKMFGFTIRFAVRVRFFGLLIFTSPDKRKRREFREFTRLLEKTGKGKYP